MNASIYAELERFRIELNRIAVNLQFHLRMFFCAIVAVLCILIISVFGGVSGALSIPVVSYSVAVSTVGVFLLVKIGGLNPKGWWFLWRGPIVTTIFTSGEDELFALSWLSSTYSSVNDYHFMFKPVPTVLCIKFRKTSAAVAFRLMV